MNWEGALYFSLWYGSGVASFVWGWTREEDLRTEILPLIIAAVLGFFGPLVFIAEWLVRNPVVLFKRRVTDADRQGHVEKQG